MVIYYIKNLVNGKGYVGQHCGDADSRWRQHLREALQVENPRPLYAAMRKYGLQNFEYEVLEQIPLELGQKELDLREIYWIHNKNTYILNGHGYNLTLGGGGNLSAFCKTTEVGKDKFNWGQYDREGNLIKVWSTALEAAKELKINEFRHIYHAADWHIGKGKHGKTAGGFMWYKLPNDQEFPQKIKAFSELGTKKAAHLRKLTIPGSSTSSDFEIAQYDVNGDLVNVWPNNMRIPQKQLGIPYPAIMNSIKGKIIFGYGYIWRRFRKGETPNRISPPQTLTGVNLEHNLFYDTPILKLNLSDGSILQEFKSINDIPGPFMNKVEVYDKVTNGKSEEWVFQKDYEN
jgi:hypothetical protein